MICCKVEIRWSYQTKSHETAHVRGICLITPNIESFDWFNRIISIIYLVSQQLIIQCDVYPVCYLNIKQIAISQERRANLKNYEWSCFII